MNEVVEFLQVFVGVFADLLIFCVFARVIFSWFQPRPSKLTMFIYYVTEPILSFFRKVVPRIGFLDLSPIVAFFVIRFVSSWLIYGLQSIL